MNTLITSHPANALLNRPVWLVSVIAGLLAAVATEIYGLLARAVGVTMEAGNIGASTAGPITVGFFAMGTLTAMFWGTILAVLIGRFATNPARIYLRTTVVLTAISLAAPLSAGATAISTKLMLCVGHVVAAAVVIPIVTRRLAR